MPIFKGDKNFEQFFYNEGDEFTNVTGGWQTGSSSGSGSTSKQSDHLFLEVTTTGSTESHRTFETQNKINFSNLNKIYIDWEGEVLDGNSFIRFQLTLNDNLNQPFGTQEHLLIQRLPDLNNAPFSRLVDEIDVSNISGEFHIRTLVRRAGRLKVYRIWGEGEKGITQIYKGEVKDGFALEFDGVDDYVPLGTKVDFGLDNNSGGFNNFTIETDFLLNTILNLNQYTLLNFNRNETAVGIRVHIENANNFAIRVRNGTSNQTFNSNFLPNLNQRYRLTITFNNGNLKTFIDGEKILDFNFTHTDFATNSTLEIGLNSVTSDRRPIDGEVSKFELYNIAYSESDVGNKNFNSNDLIAKYDFIGQGTTLPDLIGNNDGTIEGADWVTVGKIPANENSAVIKRIWLGDNKLVFGAGREYELIADVNVTTATTQIDFDNLNITKDDELRLVFTFVGDSTTTANYLLRANDITSNYHIQELNGIDTSILAVRASNNRFAFARSNRNSSGFADIKVSNNNRFVAQSQFVYRLGSDSNNIQNRNKNLVNTSTVTSITKLSVVSDRTNGIAVGSRLQLYKVVR